MKTLLIVLFLVSALSGQSNAFGEDAKIEAKHGGVLKVTKDVYLEVVHEKEKTKIYVTGRDYRNLSADKLTLSAIAYVKGKEYPLQLTFENDHYSASPGNTYLQKEKNFVLKLIVTFPGSTNNAVFNIENK